MDVMLSEVNITLLSLDRVHLKSLRKFRTLGTSSAPNNDTARFTIPHFHYTYIAGGPALFRLRPQK